MTQKPKPDGQPETGRRSRTRYGPRREGETEEDYAKRLDRGRNFMADLMGRTRRPWEYD